jgi:hypothetical protein
MLKTVIERIRGFLDDPDLEAKYSDDYIVRHIVAPAFASVMSRINNSATNPVLQRLAFPLYQNQANYQLPPCVGEVWRICLVDGSGRVLQEAIPRGLYNLRGPNWMVQGNMVSFLPYPNADYTTMELWYCSSGDYKPFYFIGGSSSAVLNAAKDTVTITLASLTPGIGEVDRRPSAYVGQMLRLLPTSVTAGTVEERVISEWSYAGGGSSTWTLKVHKPFTYASAGNLPAFEVAPEGSENMFEAVAAAGALKLATYRRLSGEHFGMIQAAYRDAMKTVMDHYSNVQMRIPKAWEKDTVDNQLTQPWRI